MKTKVRTGRLLTGTGMALFALASLAQAADLPSKVSPPTFAPPPPIPIFGWTGLYIGLQAGYEFGRDSVFVSAPGFAGVGLGYSPNGIVGGGHVGYNIAMSSVLGGDALVAGIEGDIEGADYHRGLSAFGALASTRSDLQGSLRGRLGIAVDRVLFYATGGAAFADFKTRYDTSATFGAGSIDSIDHSRVGYTVGAGVEYAFMNNFSVRAEYRYSDYGRFTDNLVNAAPGLGATVRHRETDNRVEAGVSYKFNSIAPAPVIAKY